MLKRTLYFSNPAYLSTRLNQLIIESPKSSNPHKTIPIEDIGVVILDNSQITITQPLLNQLLENNVAVITCDAQHHPMGLFYVLESNTLQSQKFKYQISASEPLKKQLWQQVIKSKLYNQAKVLERFDIPSDYINNLIPKVKSGDSDNCEAKAANYYWKNLFGDKIEFIRNRFGPPPNNILNYGYALIRALMARSLVGAGLMPTLGIHHRSQYNAFCLADDMMEAYRPYIDIKVAEWVWNGIDTQTLTKELKVELLETLTCDVNIRNQKSPMSIAVQRTAQSLSNCFSKKAKLIHLPKL